MADLRVVEHPAAKEAEEGTERMLSMLAEWTARVKAGEISGIAVAATNMDGGPLNSYYTGRNLYLSHLVGSLSLLNHRILGNGELEDMPMPSEGD